MSRTKNKNIQPDIAELADKAINEAAQEASALNAEGENLSEGQAQTVENKKQKSKEEVKQKKVKRKASFRDFIDGSILTRDYVIEQIPFLLFLALIAMGYIANKYNSEKIIRETLSIQNELKELKCEKIAVQSELMSISKQSEIAKLIDEKKLDLHLLIEPPKKIVISDFNKNTSTK